MKKNLIGCKFEDMTEGSPKSTLIPSIVTLMWEGMRVRMNVL